MSSWSASSSFSGEQMAVAISNSVSRNTARDSAVQVNGSVADRIYNLNV